MSEASDLFFQGANLGLRAAQARTQQRQFNRRLDLEEEQFRTNFAEKSRQFNLSQEIAEGNLKLRREEFTLAQQRDRLAQMRASVEMTTAMLRNQEQAKIFEEDGKYAPVVSEFLEQVQARPSSFSPMPPFPDNLPPRILNDLTEQADAINGMLSMNEASKAQEQAIEQKAKMSTQMLTVAMQVDPSIIEEDARGMQFVRPEKYNASVKIQEYLNRPAKIQALQLEELNLKKELAALKLKQEKDPAADVPTFVEWINDIKDPELIGIKSQEDALSLYRSLYNIPVPPEELRKAEELKKQQQGKQIKSIFYDRDPDTRYDPVGPMGY